MFQRIHSARLTAVTGAVALMAAGLVGLTGAAGAAPADKPGPNVDNPATAPAKVGGRANKDGVCDVDELCLIYNQNKVGARLDLFFSDSNFSGDIFRGGGAGNFTSADNNARSYISRETSVYWRVYDGINYSGTQILCIAPGDRGNFTTSLWDRASSATFSSTAC